MLKTKKSIRFLTVLAMIFAMVLSIASVPASAAGVEDWYAGKVVEPTMHTYGTNLTPIKTLKASGTLVITADFTITDTASFPNQAVCVLEIRSVNGTVLDRVSTRTPFSSASLTARTSVTYGQQVQIFTSVYNSENSAKRYADITYSHQVT